MTAVSTSASLRSRPPDGGVGGRLFFGREPLYPSFLQGCDVEEAKKIEDASAVARAGEDRPRDPMEELRRIEAINAYNRRLMEQHMRPPTPPSPYGPQVPQPGVPNPHQPYQPPVPEQPRR